MLLYSGIYNDTCLLAWQRSQHSRWSFSMLSTNHPPHTDTHLWPIFTISEWLQLKLRVNLWKSAKTVKNLLHFCFPNVLRKWPPAYVCVCVYVCFLCTHSHCVHLHTSQIMARLYLLSTYHAYTTYCTNICVYIIIFQLFNTLKHFLSCFPASQKYRCPCTVTKLSCVSSFQC